MDKEALVNELRICLSDYCKSRDLDLVDVIHRYEGKDLFLRVLIDKPEGGINLGECALINRELAEALDAKDFLRQRYILEVSSPGLDRPLKTEADFKRLLNKNVKFFLNGYINSKLEWDGIINKVSEGKVYISIKGSVLEIPLEKINKAKQIITGHPPGNGCVS
ncbi:MAG: ribosome maturation factor RimP [Candidatus Omnitrophota bacterium]